MSDSINYNILKKKEYEDDIIQYYSQELTNPKTIELLGKKKEKKKLRRDNIRSKIMNHFISFLLNFLNDYVKKIYKIQKVTFTKIKYNEKKKVDFKSIEEFMNLTLEQFCQKKCSTKCSIIDTNNNYESFLLIEDKLKEVNLNNILLSNFYSKFYLNEDKEFLEKSFGINFAKTQNFPFLLNKIDENFERKLVEQTGHKFLIFNRRNKKEEEVEEEPLKETKLIFDDLENPNREIEEEEKKYNLEFKEDDKPFFDLFS